MEKSGSLTIANLEGVIYRHLTLPFLNGTINPSSINLLPVARVRLSNVCQFIRFLFLFFFYNF